MPRAIIGALIVTAIYVLSIFSLIKMNLMSILINWGNAEVMQEALDNIPFISYGTQNGWIGYLGFILISVVLAVIGTIYVIKEFKLISAKGITKNILSNILAYVNKLEQGVSNTIEKSSAILYDAARKGENNKVVKNANSVLAITVDKQIKQQKNLPKNPKNNVWELAMYY